ncbi:mannonate dehydratase [Kaistia dalseonensis]|uniref:Mannonate dehydratase n=1 Tax=Kaistia dalseonensis TaxID=410840 RepID=A0ABU0HA54_9HYPH|nr:mannonate dehydratase [Kaistia dalseonensis]MCX5496139.1 mannonate dehydratase [Kaistia dalseonensis]MDQ0438748.1 mannonate dehydratase [Kaistia dalseonensis]
MEQTWRWFGDGDPVPLDHVKQAGATGIVTALHQVTGGRAWTVDEIAVRIATIEQAGLRWSVCESIPVPNAIKLAGPDRRRAVDAWKDSLANLGRAGVTTVCYNFMPVVDWTRTDLLYRLPTTGYALRFDMVDFVAYDVFILRRPNAEADYASDLVREAQARHQAMSESDMAQLETNIICGLPGGDGSYSRETIAALIADYAGLDATALRAHLVEFLREVVPVAEEVGVRLAIHPDDPPFSLFGLPRIVSTADDARAVIAAAPSSANGLTFCTGSYGARPDNDLVAMAQEFAPHIHFAHLRNVTREPDGSFYEAEHLDGDTDMVSVVTALLREEKRRRDAGETREIPMRPDHGHLLADDIGKKVNPGYSLIGRLKGLAELRGVMRAVSRTLDAHIAA